MPKASRDRMKTTPLLVEREIKIMAQLEINGLPIDLTSLLSTREILTTVRVNSLELETSTLKC
jgi:hypothetical protein